MKSAIGAALVVASALVGGAAITTGSSEPASAGVENSRATMATDFSARRRYRRVVRYAPRYYRHRYLARRYYAEPVYSRPASSSYARHPGAHLCPHAPLHYRPINA